MDLMQLFEQSRQEYPGFRALIAKARDITNDAGVRQQLDHLLSGMDQAFKDFETTFPAAAASVNDTLAETQRRNAETGRALAAARAEAAAALERASQEAAADQARAAELAGAAAPAAGEPALEPIDLNMAFRLREELLTGFADWYQHPSRRPPADREIWEDWEGQDEATPPGDSGRGERGPRDEP